MGNCCGREAKPDRINKGTSKTLAGKGQRLGGNSETIPLEPIRSGTVTKPVPAAKSNKEQGEISRQKILEATEKRLQEASTRGSQKGQGKLSQKLQEEKTKKLSDYAKEDYEQKQLEDNMKWRAD